jgi:hypothetical protein
MKKILLFSLLVGCSVTMISAMKHDIGGLSRNVATMDKVIEQPNNPLDDLRDGWKIVDIQLLSDEVSFPKLSQEDTVILGGGDNNGSKLHLGLIPSYKVSSNISRLPDYEFTRCKFAFENNCIFPTNDSPFIMCLQNQNSRQQEERTLLVTRQVISVITIDVDETPLLPTTRTQVEQQQVVNEKPQSQDQPTTKADNSKPDRLYTNKTIQRLTEFYEKFPTITKVTGGLMAIITTFFVLYQTDYLPIEITQMFNNLLAKLSIGSFTNKS